MGKKKKKQNASQKNRGQSLQQSGKKDVRLNLQQSDRKENQHIDRASSRVSRKELEIRARKQADRKEQEEQKKLKRSLIVSAAMLAVIIAAILCLVDVIPLKALFRTSGTKKEALTAVDNSSLLVAENDGAGSLNEAMNAGNKVDPGADAESGDGKDGSRTGTESGDGKGGSRTGTESGDGKGGSRTGTESGDSESDASNIILKDGNGASGSDAAHKYTEEVLFLTAEGQSAGYFSESDLVLSLSVDSKRGGKIYYTLDGSEPEPDKCRGTLPEATAKKVENPYNAMTYARIGGKVVCEAPVSITHTAGVKTASGEQNADGVTASGEQNADGVTASETQAVSGNDGTEDIIFEDGIYYRKIEGPEKSGTYLYDGAITLTASKKSGEPNVYPVRAVAVYDDGRVSEVTTHSFFVGTRIGERYLTTLVISLTGDPDDLTGEDGILFGENPLNQGKDYEKPISVEMIEADGTEILTQNCGLRTNGGDSRMRPAPSLKLYARKEYSPDAGKFTLDVFGTKTVTDPGKTVKKYDKLVLRNGGDDFQRSMLRDELFMQLAKKAGFNIYEAAVSTTVYLNGEYYGVLWLHESYCDDYFGKKLGSGNGEYVVLESTDQWKTLNEEDEKEYAAAKEYNAFYEMHGYSTMTDKNFAEVCDYIDVWDYLRYFAFELYITNTDWPDNNFRCYRYEDPYKNKGGEAVEAATSSESDTNSGGAESSANIGNSGNFGGAGGSANIGNAEKPYSERFTSPDDPVDYMDGRWRYALHDLDISWGTYSDTAYKVNNYANIMDGNSNGYSGLFKRLMTREDCRQYFIDYSYYLADEVFTVENVSAVMDSLAATIDTEIPYYVKALDKMEEAGVPEIFLSFTNINAHRDRILMFAKERPAYAKQYLAELEETYTTVTAVN